MESQHTSNQFALKWNLNTIIKSYYLFILWPLQVLLAISLDADCTSAMEVKPPVMTIINRPVSLKKELLYQCNPKYTNP